MQLRIQNNEVGFLMIMGINSSKQIKKTKGALLKGVTYSLSWQMS